MIEYFKSLTLFRKIRLFVLLILLLVFFIFIIQNWLDIPITFFKYSFTMPISVLILITFSLGWGIASLIKFLTQFKLESENEKLKEEINSLKQKEDA
jgi:uncharacterized integral membrane protein